MVGGEPTMAEALERLDRVLPEEVRASLQPPVSEKDLDVARAVEPFEVPEDVVTLWRWADGQGSLSAPWWPMMLCGVLCSAAGAAGHYRWLCEEAGEGQWSPLWLPVAMAEHVQAGVEMTTDRPGAVVDGDFGSGVLVVLAPSLVAVIDGTAELLEAGAAFSPADDADWRARQRSILDAARGWGAGRMTG